MVTIVVPCACVVVGCSLSFLAVLAVVPASGQGAVSEVNGNAVDSSGAVLPGVTITLTEETTGLVRSVVSNETGRFSVQALQPGRYTMRAELAGFQTQTLSGITVNVGQAAHDQLHASRRRRCRTRSRSPVRRRSSR